jgi:preprotein translocase subunit SecG
METLVTILHVLVCIFLMLTVLLQAGKGGGMGAAFGGGSSMGTVFGGSGAGNFLRRLTVAAAIIFMITSMTLAWMATPSTDPLKEYWARQQSEAAERERVHQEAVKGTGGATAPTDPAIAPPEETTDEATEETAGDETSPATEGAAEPGKDDSKAEPGKDESKSEPAKSEPAKSEPAKSEPAKAAEPKPATDSSKPAAEPSKAAEPSTPAAESKPAPSGSTP